MNFLKLIWSYITKVPKAFWFLPIFLLKVILKKNRDIKKQNKLSRELKKNKIKRDGEPLAKKVRRYNKRREKI